MSSYNIIDKYYDDYLLHNKKYWDTGINEKFLYMSELENLSSLDEVNSVINEMSSKVKEDLYLVIEYIDIDNINKYKKLELPKLIVDVDGEDIEISKEYYVSDNKLIIKYSAQGEKGSYNLERKIDYLLDENIISNLLKDNGFSEIKKVQYNNMQFEDNDFYINYIRAKKLNPLLKATPDYEVYDENYKKDTKSCCGNNKCSGCKKIK